MPENLWTDFPHYTGDTFGMTRDCTDCTLDQPNLIDQLEAAGKSWKVYVEGAPQPCFVGQTHPWYQKVVNPFIYYDSVRSNPAHCDHLVPFTQFAADLQAQTVPDFVWITPNVCHDAHDCPLSTADRWLKTWVPQILDSPAWQDQGVLFITFDESDDEDTRSCCQHAMGGRVVTLVISPNGKPAYRSAVSYDHYSLLRTIETAWGMLLLGKANCECSPTMADFFTIPMASSH